MSYIGVQPTAGQYRKLDNISSGFNGSTTAFTTSVSGTNVTAGTAQQLLVSLGGVIQQPDTDYTVSTNTITFTTAPTSGLSFFAVLMGDALNTVSVSDGSITTAKLAGNLSVGLADGTVSAPSLYFTADTNTGLYRIGANQLGLTTDGAVALTVDASQRVGIGTTSPTGLLNCHTTGTTDTSYEIQRWSTESGGILGILVDETQANPTWNFRTATNEAIAFVQNVTERARIDSSGRLLVGTSSTSNVSTAVFQDNSAANGPAVVYLSTSAATPSASASLGLLRFSASNHSPAAEIAARRDGGTWTAGSSQPSIIEFSTTADGASSLTERLYITSTGRIGSIRNPDATWPVTTSSSGQNGASFGLSGILSTSSNADACIYVNRNNADGDLVRFYSTGTQEGTISVSGTTVSYNGGHLARWSQLPDNEDPSDILKGTVMSNLDEMCEWGDEDNEQLNKTKISDVEGDPNVAGVFVATSFDDEGLLDFFVAMTGDMVIRIAAGTTVQRGDLLMSAGDGTAKPQDDDIIRSKTIAKVTSTNVSCTYDDGSYCVPCVLMAC